MKKFLLTALLAITVAVLSRSGIDMTDTAQKDTSEPEPIAAEEIVEGAKNVLALVPIDDRPDNVECAKYIAQMVGYEVVTPERDLYSTKLNNQPLNENGTQYGDRAALYEWLMQMEKDGCDRYVICLDQLLSGGLVASRDMTEHENLVFSNGKTMSEFNALRTLVRTLAADENNRVWFLDTVMRLAPTVGYLEWTEEDYYSMRAYASVPRPDLKELEFRNLAELYRLNERGRKIDPKKYNVDEAKLEEYLMARQRKMELAEELLKLVNELDTDRFRVIFGVDDSSEEESIQENEIACLREHMRDCDYLLSGVDDLEFKAISRLYLDDIGWSGEKACVRYFGDSENKPACDYDYRSLEKVVDEHMDFFSLEDDADAQLQILVLTSPKNVNRAESYCDDMIRAINENEENHIPTILIDASNMKYDSMFRDKLKDETDIGWLVGYAGFLDMSIVTGAGFSRGVARYAVLKQGDVTYTSDIAYMQMMTDAFVRDFCYIGECRSLINSMVTEEYSGATSNFYAPEIDSDAVTEYMQRLMDKQIPSMVESLQNSSYIASLDEYEVKPWEEIDLNDCNFPWNRTFELRVDIAVDGTEDASRVTVNLEDIIADFARRYNITQS